jgi:hypothetical protein
VGPGGVGAYFAHRRMSLQCLCVIFAPEGVNMWVPIVKSGQTHIAECVGCGFYSKLAYVQVKLTKNSLPLVCFEDKYETVTMTGSYPILDKHGCRSCSCLLTYYC